MFRHPYHGMIEVLADVLTIHENEGRKTLFQGWNGITDQRLIRTENPDQRTRLQKDDTSHNCNSGLEKLLS